MTIRAINLVLFGILALIGVALATLVAKGSLDRYRAIEEASDINGFSGRVSGIMAALAVERGTTNTVLGDIEASTPDQLDTIKNRRLFADGGLDALVEEVSRHSHISGPHPAGAGIEKAMAQLAETRAAVAAMRARFDRVVAGGPEDKALGTEWFKTITGMVFAVDGLRAALERHLEAEVPEAIVRAFMVRARLIELAEFAGQERGFMGGAIASEKRLRAYEIEFVAKARGRIEGAWAVITGHDGDLGPAYEAARAEAELRFFQEFGTLRQEVFDAAVLGRLYPVTAREWFKRATAAMATVLAAQAAAEQAIGAAVEAQRRTALTEVVAAGTGVALALVVTLVAFLILRARVVRPLKTLAERMLALARGDTGVSLPAVTRTDEVGVMYSALIIFHQAMEERQRFTEERERFQVEQQDVLRRTLREMTDAVEDDLAAAVRHVVELSTTMEQAAVEVATVVAAIRDEATTVASVADQANASAAGVASTSEEVAATGREIARQAGHSSQVARGGVAKAQDAVSAVKGLREATNRIGAVAKVIAGIAGRTNLLALNATIEAARAGAAGKGFAVVATEVKALSNQTSRATGEIDQQVRDVQVAVDKSAHAIDDVIGVIADIDQMATTVAAAIEQQEAANLEMSRTAGEVAQGSHQLAESVVDISTRTDHAAALARTVERQARITNSAVTKLGSRLVMVMRQSVAGDRRDSQRVPVTLPLTARWEGRQATGTTVDISDSGMLMRIEPGVEIRVQQALSVEIERVGTIACVVIGASQRGMHVTFTSVEPAAQQCLKQVIADTLAQDQPYLKAAQDTAARITDAINKAVGQRRINIEDMFARDYDPIDGTNPQQYMARFTKIADEIFPPVQEPVLTALPRVLFCIASDRNGYIATHNAKYALPQRPNDPAWNAANCRNRRLFDDYSGLLASRSTAPFLLQAYDRDMGGGRRELIKEADAPITLNGQHWGAVRIGFGVG